MINHYAVGANHLCHHWFSSPPFQASQLCLLSSLPQPPGGSSCGTQRKQPAFFSTVARSSTTGLHLHQSRFKGARISAPPSEASDRWVTPLCHFLSLKLDTLFLVAGSNELGHNSLVLMLDLCYIVYIPYRSWYIQQTARTD